MSALNIFYFTKLKPSDIRTFTSVSFWDFLLSENFDNGIRSFDKIVSRCSVNPIVS
jgi:hypothetical protein